MPCAKRQLLCDPRKPNGFGDRVFRVDAGPSGELLAVAILFSVVGMEGGHPASTVGRNVWLRPITVPLRDGSRNSILLYYYPKAWSRG
jgi:hypothetical protein